MKHVYTALTLATMTAGTLNAQMLYDDFEATSKSAVQYVSYGGDVTFNAPNPDALAADTNGNCLKLVKTTQWDSFYIQGGSGQTFDDVSEYLGGDATKRMSIWIYAPVDGVVCKAQLRNSSSTAAESFNGIKAEFYSAPLEATDQWVKVDFNWAWEPDATVAADEIDELMITIANKGDNPDEPDGVNAPIHIDNIYGPEFTVVTQTAVEEFAYNNFQLTPNGINSFRVNGVANANNVQASIYNISGQLVKQPTISGSVLDLNGLQTGVYLVHIAGQVSGVRKVYLQ